MKLVFAGTPEFAAFALERLIQEGHDVQAVLTQPDRPAGRGRKLKESEVKSLAKAHGIPVYCPKTLRRSKGGEETGQVLDALKQNEPDLLIVAAYGLIIPQELLDLPQGILKETVPDLKAINIHGSLLPDWRGAAPIARGLQHGDKQAGVTLMQMDAGLDTGPMLYRKGIDIEETDTAGSLTEKVGRLGAEMLVEYLKSPETHLPQVQPENASYARKLDKSESPIDWTRSAFDIARQVKAFNPFPGSVFKHNGLDIKAWFASVAGSSSGASAGTVLTVGKDGIEVSAGDGTVVRLEELQKPGGKKLKAKDFLSGYPIRKGEVLQ